MQINFLNPFLNSTPTKHPLIFNFLLCKKKKKEKI